MQFKMSGKHLDVTPAIREYAETKTRRLHRYWDRIQAITAVIDKHDLVFEVELIVDAEHTKPFVASEKGGDLYGCIDSVTDKLERQLTDHKEKHRNRKHIA